MKKNLVLLLVLGLLVGVYSFSFASVVNTKHDMFFMSKGIDPNVCGYCHVPHNAAGDKIWSTWANEAQLTSGPSSTIGNMCYTCHDGTATSLGQTTAFNAALQQHKTDTGTDCNICHTVHDNANGKFLGIAKTQSANTESATYCETCHDATMYPGADPHGDHLAGTEHPYKDTGAVLDESCNACHQMHGAVNYTTTSLTNPILKVANADSAYCATCHVGYVQAAIGGNKHPANLSSGGSWGKVDCATCHDPHQPADSGRPSILKDANTDSAYCATCHQATGTVKGPTVGTFSHPTSVGFTTVGLTPAGNNIDDDNDGADYPGNSASLVCESCHSVHKKGVSGKLLRITATAGALCVNCHSGK
ncbi:MAG: cytochrome c3 family protein [Candidatus Omnitrophota bacterium]|nr:cytochrome c3 family protein [Candidatus Omnitrophota bacterium]